MRVLVTRPRDQAAATARRLAELGHEAILAPVLEIVPTGKPAPHDDFDVILLTSANAVGPVAAERARFGIMPMLAVGIRTAAAARDAGFKEVRQAGGDGLALVELVRQAIPIGARLLHAAGRDRKAEPAASLVAAGYALRTWECYQAAPATALPPGLRSALSAGQVDAALHFSRRSAATFAQLARTAGLSEALAGTLHLCLSPDVAEGLDGLVELEVRIAPRPDEASLVGLLPETMP